MRTLLKIIEKVSEVCFMPLAFGGGVGCYGDARDLITNGADKVVLNSAVFSNPNLVAEVSENYGSQAVVVSIDVRKDPSTGAYRIYSNCGTTLEAVSLEAHIAAVVGRGAGEIFINSIDRDGTMSGYDVELIKRTVECAPVPVIACGGAGNYEDMRKAFVETQVSALACGSLFNFGDNNPIRAKAFLSNYNLPFKKV